MQLPKALSYLGCKAVGFVDSFSYAQRFKKDNPEFDVASCFKKGGFLPISFFKEIVDPKIKWDAVLIEQNGFSFKNDVDIPVAYYHRDTPTSLFMLDMDILLYRFNAMEGQIAKDHPHVWDNGIVKKRWLNGVDAYEFLHEKKKIYKGINWIGWCRPFEYYWQYPDQVEYYKFARYIAEESEKEDLITRHKSPIPYLKYKDILQKSEAVLIVPGNGSYVTRKIYEAAVSKTLIVLWVQDNEAMKAFKEIGLIPNVNCIMFRTIPQLKQIKEKWDQIKDRKKILVKNAFEWVISNHTWLNRGRELLEIVSDYNKVKANG